MFLEKLRLIIKPKKRFPPLSLTFFWNHLTFIIFRERCERLTPIIFHFSLEFFKEFLSRYFWGVFKIPLHALSTNLIIPSFYLFCPWVTNCEWAFVDERGNWLFGNFHAIKSRATIANNWCWFQSLEDHLRKKKCNGFLFYTMTPFLVTRLSMTI